MSVLNSNFKGVVKLTEAQYNTLKTNGTITVEGTTLTYDATGTIYMTTDNVQYVPTSTTINNIPLSSSITLTPSDVGAQSLIDSNNKLDADLVDDSASTNKFVTSSDKSTWNAKQDALVSGTNIKTINNGSILGSGNINVVNDVTLNGNSIVTNGVIAVDNVPTQNSTNLVTSGGVYSAIQSAILDSWEASY